MGAIFNLGRYEDLLGLFAKSLLRQNEDLPSIFLIVRSRMACCDVTFLHELFPRRLFQSKLRGSNPDPPQNRPGLLKFRYYC